MDEKVGEISLEGQLKDGLHIYFRFNNFNQNYQIWIRIDISCCEVNRNFAEIKKPPNSLVD